MGLLHKVLMDAVWKNASFNTRLKKKFFLEGVVVVVGGTCDSYIP